VLPEIKVIEVASNLDTIINYRNTRKLPTEIKGKFGKRVLQPYVVGCVNARKIFPY
jgi:hypothetical protein